MEFTLNDPIGQKVELPFNTPGVGNSEFFVNQGNGAVQGGRINITHRIVAGSIQCLVRRERVRLSRSRHFKVQAG